MKLVKSKVAPLFWFSDGRKYFISIDLMTWGIGISFGASWHVRFLCFAFGRQ